MPLVGKKHFPYTDAGMKAAARARSGAAMTENEVKAMPKQVPMQRKLKTEMKPMKKKMRRRMSDSGTMLA